MQESLQHLHELNTLFNVFHDGSIIAWVGDKEKLTLTIECSYLAECIMPGWERFYLGIEGVECLTWESWQQNPAKVETDLALLLQFELEIIGAELNNDRVKITCYHYEAEKRSGGVITLSCNSFKLLDQQQRLLPVSALLAIANEYWEDFDINK